MKRLAILILAIILTAGCIENPLIAMQKVPVEVPPVTTVPPRHTIPPTPVEVPEPTTTIPTPTPTPVPVATYNPDDDRVTDADDDWVDDETVIIPPAESNVTLINFTTFRNNDFLIEYPETWTVHNSSSTRINNRIWSTPETLKEEVRHVTFLSEDRNTSMNVTVYSFIAPGNHKINQNVQAVKDKITTEYTGVDGYKVVSGYKYFVSDQKINTVSYDLIFPDYSEWYPLAYTEWTFVTYSHLFVFDFVSETGELAKYNDLRYRMFSSIRTEGILPQQGLGAA